MALEEVGKSLKTHEDSWQNTLWKVEKDVEHCKI